MTREFYKSGQLVPVTVLKMEKARVIQVIDKEKEVTPLFNLDTEKSKTQN